MANSSPRSLSLPCSDVSSVELLMNNHQGIKAEIDARNDSFSACIELGKSLLARKHYAAEEVRSHDRAYVKKKYKILVQDTGWINSVPCVPRSRRSCCSSLTSANR